MRTTPDLVQATVAHASQIADELALCRGEEPLRCAVQAIGSAHMAWTVMVDGVPGCIAGFAFHPAPWVLLMRRAEMREDILEPSAVIIAEFARCAGRHESMTGETALDWLFGFAYRVPSDPQRLDRYLESAQGA